MTKANEGYDYFSVFPQRLSNLMRTNDVTQKTIADVCNVRRQSVSEWVNGNTRPDILSLVEIAKYFNVSTDYLLGLTDVKTTKTATRELCSSLGLTENTVSILSADISSPIAEKIKEQLAPGDWHDDALKEIVSFRAKEISSTFNRLIDDYINQNICDSLGCSLLSHLMDFYTAIDTTAIDTTYFEIGDEEHAYNIQSESMTIWGETTHGESWSTKINLSEILIDTAINGVTAKLNNIKYELQKGRKNDK